RYGVSLLPVCLTVSPDILRQRLQMRGRENDAEIAARLERAAHYPPFNCPTVNNDGSLLQSVERLLILMGRKEEHYASL
ncbi:ribose 1,5-bisphosphokinase, partial [Salmonella enterica subsp. enterica serovar Newport str. CFSAN000835]